MIEITNSEYCAVKYGRDNIYNTIDDIGIWLSGLLFGVGEEEADALRTYLIVDATLRKDVTGAFDLDQLDVPCVCLFQGAAADSLADAAPYIIDLTPPDDAEVRMPRAISNFISRHWGRNTGIVMRSSASIEELRRHLRYFIRMQREDTGDWVLFRFWDGRVALSYFEYLAQNEARAAAWFRDGDKAIVSEIIVEGDSRCHAWIIRHGHSTPGARIAGPRTAKLSVKEIAALMSASENAFYRNAARDLAGYVANESFYAKADIIVRTAYLKAIGRFAHSQNFQTRRSIVSLGLISLVLGLGFARDPRYGEMLRAEVSRQPASESERLIAARELYEQIEPNYLSDGGQDGMRERIKVLLKEEPDVSSAAIFRHVAPAQMEALTDGQLMKLGQHFFYRHPQLLGLPKPTQRAATALLVAFGADWPTNPLYDNLWQALFAADWRNQLLVELSV